MQRIEWAVVSWTNVTQVMRIKIKLFHERPLLKRALQSLQRAQNDSIHKATSAILWMDPNFQSTTTIKKNLLYFFFAIFQLQYLSFNHMTFVKNHELLWGQEMTKFTKKQVPFCEWGQSAQLSIYYYDKKNLFFTFFLPFFRFNIYTYIWHL